MGDDLQSRLMDVAVRTLRLARRKGGKGMPAFEPGSDSTDRVARYALRLKSQFFRQETMAVAARSVGLGGPSVHRVVSQGDGPDVAAVYPGFAIETCRRSIDRHRPLSQCRGV